MNILKVGFITAVALLGLMPKGHAETTVTIRDFLAAPFDYGYEEWKDLVAAQSKTTNGVEIKGSAKGGVGAFFNDPVDISENKQIEIKIKKGASNSEDALLLKLVSADGKSSSWNIAINTLSSSDFTVVKFDLATVRGVKDAVDLETIKQLQIQGTFNPTTSVDFEIASISASGTYTAPAPAASAPSTPTAPAK